jgi:hypothetical protein
VKKIWQKSSSTSFRSRDLRVTNFMGPARYTSCAMLLNTQRGIVLLFVVAWVVAWSV